MRSVYEVITLKDIPQMGSATWFLVVLFDVCVIHCFITFAISKVQNSIVRKSLWVTIFVACLIIAYAISEGAVDTEKYAMRHLQLFEVYSCYLMGVFAKEYSYLLPTNKKVIAGCCSLAGLVFLYSVMLSIGTLEMSKCYIVHPVFLIVVTALGMVMLAGFAMDLENNKLGDLLTYIGKHTMSILFLHILSFSCFFILCSEK